MQRRLFGTLPLSLVGNRSEPVVRRHLSASPNLFLSRSLPPSPRLVPSTGPLHLRSADETFYFLSFIPLSRLAGSFLFLSSYPPEPCGPPSDSRAVSRSASFTLSLAFLTFPRFSRSIRRETFRSRYRRPARFFSLAKNL